VKRQLKIAISLVFYVLGWPASALANAVGMARQRLVILYYHDIPTTTRARFARQMDKLKQRATVVDADWRGGPVKGLVCAVTFDDAFVSVIDNALPELAKRGMPCTIFVPVAALGRPPGWAMEANYAPGEIVADPELVKSLPSSLVTLGAHTLTHPYLSRLPPETARAEIENSRTMLSAITGRDVNLMSFPYGDYNEEVEAMCKRAGYELVYGILPTTVYPQDGTFVRGRVAVGPNDGDLEFFLKTSGSYWWVSPASALKQAVLAPVASMSRKKNVLDQRRERKVGNRWSGSL